MKPNEYIKKFNLNGNLSIHFGEIQNELIVDFISLVEYFKRTNNWNITQFKNCVKHLRQKFDSINNKCGNKLNESMWKYIYATVIIKIKDQEFGEYLKKQREKKVNMDNDFFDEFNFYERIIDELFNGRFNGMFNKMFSPTFPEKSFKIFSLHKNATVDELNKNFRELALKKHPDKGGNSEEFRELIEAKNNCLQYISRNARILG